MNEADLTIWTDLSYYFLCGFILVIIYGPLAPRNHIFLINLSFFTSFFAANRMLTLCFSIINASEILVGIDSRTCSHFSTILYVMYVLWKRLHVSYRHQSPLTPSWHSNSGFGHAGLIKQTHTPRLFHCATTHSQLLKQSCLCCLQLTMRTASTFPVILLFPSSHCSRDLLLYAGTTMMLSCRHCQTEVELI